MADFERDNVRSASKGRIFYAEANDAAAVAPTGWAEDTDWGAAWSSLGLFSEDGVTHEFSDDVEEKRSWQRGIVRILTTARTLTLGMTALESSVPVIEMFYDTQFALSGDETYATLQIPHETPRSEYKFAFEWYDPKGDSTWRLLLPVASVSEVEPPAFVNSDTVNWGMTIRALGSDLPYLAEWSTNDPEVLAALGAV